MRFINSLTGDKVSNYRLLGTLSAFITGDIVGRTDYNFLIDFGIIFVGFAACSFFINLYALAWYEKKEKERFGRSVKQGFEK